MRKDNDLEPVKTICRVTTMDIFDHYRETYSKEDIDNLTEYIMRFGYMINGLDFGLFKTKAISGEYKNRVQIIDGRSFDIKFFRLSPDVYLDWFQEYIFQRGKVFENNSHLIHKKVESEPISEKTVEMLKKLAETVKPKPSDLIYFTDESEYIKEAKKKQQSLELEFEKIWMEQGCTETEGSNPVKFINEKGKFMVKVDYVKLKFENGK